MSTPGGFTAGDPEAFEGLVVECLAAIDTEGMSAVDRFCALHPGDAAALRQRIGPLISAGLVGSAALDRLPERIGEFRILERLGGGGMGVVFRARQESPQRDVALKLVRSDCLLMKGGRERFRREVDAVARVNHPNIVPVFSVGEHDGVPFFTMELVEGLTLADVVHELRAQAAGASGGGTLASLFARHAPTSETGATQCWRGPWPDVALRIMQQVALALDHAHRRGIVHRDVKPSNIMITASGRVLLMDFGLASGTAHATATVTTSNPGTLPYMSPERLSDVAGGDDPRGDVYGCGVTLFELLSLRPPFLRATPEETRRAILDGAPPPLRGKRSAISWEAETVCLAAMDRDPARRYASAGELAADLGNALERLPITARRAGLALRSRRWIGRHPAASVALGLGLLLLGAATTLAVRERDLRRVLAENTAGPVVRDLVARAAALGPPLPESAPTMRDWLSQAEPLLGNRSDRVEQLAELRAGALPFGDAARATSRLLHPDLVADLEEAERVARLVEEDPDWLADKPAWRAAILEEKRAARDAARSSLEARRVWDFASPADQHRHDALATLVADLDRLSGVASDVRERLGMADRCGALGHEHEQAWHDARAAIQASPAYQGLGLAPQSGLVPLRENPRTRLWEFWYVPSGDRPVAEPTAADPMRWGMRPETGIVLVLIPGGRYRVGADVPPAAPAPSPPHPDASVSDLDSPSHEVVLDPFFIAAHETTQAQWKRMSGSNPSLFQGHDWSLDTTFDGTHPVEQVSEEDGERVAASAGLQVPTGAQWEVACRAGTTMPYFTGTEPATLQGYANIEDKAFRDSGFHSAKPDQPTVTDDGFIRHAPVGSFLPNPFGLYDMVGNVSEYCRDLALSYDAMEHEAGDGLSLCTNPVLNVQSHFMRGGNWAYPYDWARSAQRVAGTFGSKAQYVGIRFVRRVEVP